MNPEFSKPTISIRNLDSRCVEIEINAVSDYSHSRTAVDARAWSEFRRQLLLFAFEEHDVTLVGESGSALIKALTGALESAPDEVVELRDESGERGCALRWRRCPAKILTAIANDGDFELNSLFLASIGTASASRLSGIGKAFAVEFNEVPFVTDELLHCTGDSDGYVMRWFNPGISEGRIVERLKTLCQQFSWDFVRE
jgi:hypothetical protein